MHTHPLHWGFLNFPDQSGHQKSRITPTRLQMLSPTIRQADEFPQYGRTFELSGLGLSSNAQ
jgi:hypothetical protein